MKNTDILIAGAGPAGSAASLYLSKAGITHTLIDKSRFPRDKVCGDAISGKVMEEIYKINGDSFNSLLEEGKAIVTEGIRFVAPNNKSVDIPFPQNNGNYPVGLVSTRLDFDNYLQSKAEERPECNFQIAELKGIDHSEDFINLKLRDQEQHKTKFLIDASGSRSPISHKIFNQKIDQKFYCGGLRQYYEGVSDLVPGNFLELHFIKDLLPGYFWIFPLPGNKVNVGLGMLSSYISKKKVDLKKLLNQIIREHPEIKKRFKNAIALESPKGWGLPLGSRRLPLVHGRTLLTGDAASLIDPFTGEGIGNAVLSGRMAAEAIVKSIEYDSDSRLQLYEEQLYDEILKELKLSRNIQQLTLNKPLFNFIVNKISKSEKLKAVFTNMFVDVNVRAQLNNPLFYFNLLFNF